MKHEERLFRKGNRALVNGDPKRAVSLYNRSLDIAPGNLSVLMNKAGALTDQRIYDEALDTIELAISINPNIAKCWGMKGDVLGALGRTYEALISYERAIQLDPDDPRLTAYRDQLLRRAKP